MNSNDLAQYEALIKLLNAYYLDELGSCLDKVEIANCTEPGCPSVLYKYNVFFEV